MIKMTPPRQKSGEAIYIKHAPVLVGNCEFVNVQLDDDSVAEFHCSLRLLDDKLCVRDLGSGHNTELNGYSIRESVVVSGDRLTLGQLHFDVDYKHAKGVPPKDVILVKATD